MSSSSFPIAKIKTVFRKEIRRLELPEVSYSQLRTSIANAFNLPPRSFTLSFKDDEGDVCRIGSDAELAEALTVAEDGQTLKIYVSSDEDSQAVDSDVEIEELAYATGVDPAVSPAAARPRAQPQQEPKAKSAPPAPTPAPAPEEKTAAPPSPEELQALAMDFLGNQDVQTALLPFANTLLTLLEGTEDVDTLIEIALASHEVVGAHPLVTRLRPLLPVALPVLSEKVALLRARPEVLQQVRQMLPIFLFPALHAFNQARQASAQTAQAPDLQQLFGGLPLPPGVREMLSEVASMAAQADDEDEDSESEDEEEALTSKPTEPVPEDAHRNIACDGCGMSPIVGHRYKCSICDDFDLCADCESKDVHPASHPLIKMKVPYGSSQHLKEVQHHGVSCDGCGAAPIVGPRFKCSVCFNFDLCEPCENKNIHDPTHPVIKLKLPQGTPATGASPSPGPAGPERFGPWRRGGHCGRGRGGPLRMMARALFGGHRGGHGPHGHHGHGPHGPHGPGPFGPHGHGPHGHGPHGPHRHHSPHGHCRRFGGPGGQCGRGGRQASFKAQASFVRDGSLPDRSVVEPGGTLIKAWVMKNPGTQPWPAGSKLIFLRGDRELSAEEEFPVPAAEPGQEVEVSAVLTPPSKPTQARYTAYYRLADDERSVFGPKLWADVVVKPASAAPATPAAAALPEEKKDSVAPSAAPSSAETKAEEAGAPADPALVEKYAMQLQILRSMGFRDEAAVLTLLHQHGGDVPATYKELVKLLV